MYSEEIFPNTGLYVKVVKDSVYKGKRIVTLEIIHPRYLLEELLKERYLSITSKVVEGGYAWPSDWGSNKLVNLYTLSSDLYETALSKEEAWREGIVFSEKLCNAFKEQGYSEELCDVLKRPFQLMKSVVTATEWGIIGQGDCSMEYKKLVGAINRTLMFSTPVTLKQNEWHTPYVEGDVSQDVAIKLSAVRCYNTWKSNTINEEIDVYRKVFTKNERMKYNALEHQAIPIELGCKRGITHFDLDEEPWCNNFKCFIQHKEIV